jgi:hypothetical protein
VHTGVYYDGMPCVEIPYYDRDGKEYPRTRLRLNGGKNGHRWNSGTATLIPYGLHRPVPYDEGFVIIPEGETDCFVLWQHGFAALGLPGADSAACLRAEHLLDASKVYVVQEPDKGGSLFPGKVAVHCYREGYTGDVFAVVLPNGIKDARALMLDDPTRFTQRLQEAMRTATRIERNEAERITAQTIAAASNELALSLNASVSTSISSAQKLTRTLDMVPLSMVASEEVTWLWAARIPQGKLTLLVGDPGQGKSYTTLGIAGAITTGQPLPGDESDVTKTPRSVIMWNGEDGIGDTIRPRAEKIGVDLDRLHVIRGMLDEESNPLAFEREDFHRIGKGIEQLGDVAMVVIDPIASLLGDIDTHRDAAVRGALRPFADFAERYHVAVLAVMHLRKDDADRAIYRVGGSIGFTGVARSVLLAAVDPDNGRRAIAPIKGNLSEKALPIEYRIDEEGHFWWVGVAEELTAEHLLRAPSHKRPSASRDEAKAYLLDALANGPRLVSDIEAGLPSSISDRTYNRARKDLGLRAKFVSEAGKEAGKKGAWVLSLPDLSQNEEGATPPL